MRRKKAIKMATNKRGEGSRQSKFSNKTPHFFKVVFSPVSQGLRIPTAFMEKYGDSLKDKKVVLNVPTGASWPVKLRQTDDGTWLGKGWQEFAAFYAIEMRYFLVFRYHGNSQFHVIIFDPTASEIEYPVESKDAEHKDRPVTRRTTQIRKLNEIETPDDDDDDEVKILGEKPSSSGRTGKRRKTGANRKQASVESDSDASVKILEVRLPSPSRTSEGRKTGMNRKAAGVKVEQDNFEKPNKDFTPHRYNLRQGITRKFGL